MKLIENLKAAAAAGVSVKAWSTTETHRGVAWSCKVYLDGKKLGMVSNEGCGGMTRIDFGAAEQSQVVQRLKAHGYKLELTLDGTTVSEPTDDSEWLDFAIGQIGDELTMLKQYRRKAKTQVFVERRTKPPVVVYKAADNPQVRTAIKHQLGDDFVAFLNDDFAAL
jgi:hypothetical protein